LTALPVQEAAMWDDHLAKIEEDEKRKAAADDKQ